MYSAGEIQALLEHFPYYQQKQSNALATHLAAIPMDYQKQNPTSQLPERIGKHFSYFIAPRTATNTTYPCFL